MIVIHDPTYDNRDQGSHGHIFGGQQFIEVDKYSKQLTSAEISCMDVSDDGYFLCCGTNEASAKIIIWEMKSRTCISNTRINNCACFLNIKFSFDHSRICALGLTPDNT